jgi:hypothetical protein
MFLRSLSVIAAGCALLIASASINAQQKQQRGPSTWAERQQAFAYSLEIQADPLSPGLVPKKAWLRLWLYEVPDIRVHICSFVEMAKGDKKHSNVLFDAMMAAQTAFAIQHLYDKPDTPAEIQAGIEGMLIAYEKVIAAHPKDHQPTLDDLLARRQAGTLDDYLSQQIPTRCSEVIALK